MLSLLRSIVETITLLFSFIANLVMGLLTFVGMIPTYVTFLTDLIAVVPAFAQVFFTAGIALTVICFLINKETS